MIILEVLMYSTLVGWGDRLAGFYCGETTKSYVGIDPNTLNHPNYQRQVEFYKKHQTFFEEEKQVEFICSPAEDVDFTKYKEHFDTVFTSPPYFNVEKYSDEDTQSYIRYKDIDSWNKNFLHKTLGNIIPTLKKDGLLAINIADVYDAKNKTYFDICNPMNDFIKSQGLHYFGCIGMEMTKRFNSGGAGNAKSEYFQEYLKDKTKHTKDIAFWRTNMDLEKIKEDGYHVLIGDYKPHDEKIIDIAKRLLNVEEKVDIYGEEKLKGNVWCINLIIGLVLTRNSITLLSLY